MCDQDSENLILFLLNTSMINTHMLLVADVLNSTVGEASNAVTQWKQGPVSLPTQLLVSPTLQERPFRISENSYALLKMYFLNVF
jgi:hypothetical protein